MPVCLAAWMPISHQPRNSGNKRTQTPPSRAPAIPCPRETRSISIVAFIPHFAFRGGRARLVEEGHVDPLHRAGQPWTRSRVRPAAGVKLGPGSRLGPESESRLGKWVRVKVGRLHARRGRRAACDGGLARPNRWGARIASRRKTAESRRIAPGGAEKPNRGCKTICHAEERIRPGQGFEVKPGCDDPHRQDPAGTRI